MPELTRVPIKPLRASIYDVGKYHTASDVGDLAMILMDSGQEKRGRRTLNGPELTSKWIISTGQGQQVHGLYVAEGHPGVILAPPIGRLTAEEIVDGRRTELIPGPK